MAMTFANTLTCAACALPTASSINRKKQKACLNFLIIIVLLVRGPVKRAQKTRTPLFTRENNSHHHQFYTASLGEDQSKSQFSGDTCR